MVQGESDLAEGLHKWHAMVLKNFESFLSPQFQYGTPYPHLLGHFTRILQYLK